MKSRTVESFIRDHIFLQEILVSPVIHIHGREQRPELDVVDKIQDSVPTLTFYSPEKLLSRILDLSIWPEEQCFSPKITILMQEQMEVFLFLDFSR